ncbi:hypothetical protein QJP79_25760 (plasmid) [Escherichia coli]|uniref:hypothetical protein n=1 Tax=Escherichia coli TaxID=562 RepID=UPI0024B3D0D9|nr:hypothetical protein [Escherichia coli]WHD24949.1 hypothetical protein QJP79_25760 [Escherichia coli]
MKKYLILFFMMFSASAMAKIGYVDEHQKEVDLKIDALISKYEKECEGKRNSNMCKSRHGIRPILNMKMNLEAKINIIISIMMA